ncbi:MAG: DNA methyltransferase [Candidatus Dormibacteria bacterium]
MDTGVIYCDDNYERLAHLPRESVDLIYLDPPFFSNRHYEVIWGDEAEVRSFEDRWEGGIYHYVEWMKERVMEMWRLLKPTGSIFLHCDWHASHYLKVMLDEVCGDEHFQNELVWYYRGGGVSPRRFGRRHDVIFWYTKGKEWTFNVDEVRTAYSAESMERLKYTARSFRHEKTYDTYRPNPLGKHPDDVLEIQPTMPSSKERMGYPTQKPEKLLEVLIKAASNVGDVVLDPFAGCGTALVVAHRLKREWVGIDISPTACNLMQRRLQKAGALSIRQVGMPATLSDLHALKPFEFQNWIIDRINGIQANRKSGDMGIDGYTFFLHDPVQIKQSESIGRNMIDNFETAVRRDGKRRGVVVAFSFGRGAVEEVARVRRSDGLDIQLVTVAELLERLDEVMVRMGVTSPSGALPGLEALPMPQIDSSRRSADELVKSEKGVDL